MGNPYAQPHFGRPFEYPPPDGYESPEHPLIGVNRHFQATAKRFAAADGPILVLQDTTEFSFKRERPEAIGFKQRIRTGNTTDQRKRLHSVCGILMHASLAVTTSGLPLGLAAVKFWTRKKFKGARALASKINPTRVPIQKKESVRWLRNLEQSTALFAAPDRCVHVGDRESDIYELFCKAHELGTHFVVRTCVDRLAGDGKHTIADEMEEVAVKGHPHRRRHRARKIWVIESKRVCLHKVAWDGFLEGLFEDLIFTLICCHRGAYQPVLRGAGYARCRDRPEKPARSPHVGDPGAIAGHG
jgi:hypothetical protein